MSKKFLILLSVVMGTVALAERERSECRQMLTLRALAELSGTVAPEIDELLPFVCRPGSPGGTTYYPNSKIMYVGAEYADAGSWKYSNGGYAFVASHFQDAGSWKYPNGNFAFVGPAYQDKDSWKYPNGNFAFVGPGYQDAGSWKWPNGNFAFVGPAYQDKDSWKYPNGNFAFVGPGYQDAGSWKYPNSAFAFAGPAYSDAGTWYYPNRTVFSKNSTADRHGEDLVNVVGLYKSATFTPSLRHFYRLPRALQTMDRLMWVQAQLP